MGVGAVYVSTYAVTQLPKPHSPPQDQAEILASAVQTIVAFVVLGSIIIREYMSVCSGFSAPLTRSYRWVVDTFPHAWTRHWRTDSHPHTNLDVASGKWPAGVAS